MKKINVITAAVFAAAAMGLCSCSVGFMNTASIGTYDNADKYTAGDLETTEKIEAVDIEWASGKVDITTGGSGSVTVKETAKTELSDKEKVHTWVNGGVLYVKFCKSGEKVDGDSDKRVEITLPEGVVLDKLTAEASSADVKVNGVSAKTASFEASSGELEYYGNAGSIDFETSSGNISFKGEADSISAEASSGEVTIEQSGEGSSLSVETSSGDISVSANITGKFSTESSSGEHIIKLGSTPSSTRIESSSGDVKLTLPESAEFNATIDTSSGDVSYELPMQKTGDNSYTCGSSNNELGIETSSGDVKILKN